MRMNIWNSVLLGLIFLTAAFFTVLVANTYNLQKEWEEKLIAQDRQIQTETEAIARLKTEIYGDASKTPANWDEMSLMAKKSKMEDLLPGYTWTNAQPSWVDEDKLIVSFKLPSDRVIRHYAEMKLSEETRLFVFDSGRPVTVSEEGENGENSGNNENQEELAPARASCVGAFTVVNVDQEAKQIDLALATGDAADPAEIEALKTAMESGNGWIVCDSRLPVDSPNDLAYWLETEPEGLFAKSLTDEEKAYFSQKGPALEDLKIDTEGNQEIPADQMDDYIARLTLPEGTRLAVRYDELIVREYYKRNDLKVYQARLEKSVDYLNQNLCTQWRMIGLTDIPTEVVVSEEKGAENLVTKLGEAGIEALKQIWPTVNFNAETFIQQKERWMSQLSEMETQRDMVKDRLDLSADTAEKVNERIEFLIQDNRRLATEIAKSQFEAADKIIKRSEAVASLGDEDAKIEWNQDENLLSAGI